MSIRFQFDHTKAIEAMAFLLNQLKGSTDKIKLIKLLYIADREHFLRYGRPITGDDQYALPQGPVPSQSLDLLNGNLLQWNQEAFARLHTEDDSVNLRTPPDVNKLTESEREILTSVIRDHGWKRTWDLVDETHRLPEYRDTYPSKEKTSVRIPYEVILKCYGSEDENLFRLGRPVISPEMGRAMLCPFTGPEPDL